FSLSSLISDAIKSIKDYFYKGDGTGILEFDFADALPDFEMPDFGEMIKGVVRSVFPTSLFDKTFFGYGLKDFLPDSLAKFLTEPDKTSALGGTFKPGESMLVGELGPEMILPSSAGTVMSASRTAQIQQAGLERGMNAAGGGGGPYVDARQANTVNTKNTSTTMFKTKPTDVVTALASAA
ncbi:MAG: hypothetical protein QGH83_04330, partial [Candidatus Pacebacteria bacterium]|nr:hypothetical protein [Candidatus Paceibacterota bacterium]